MNLSIYNCGEPGKKSHLISQEQPKIAEQIKNYLNKKEFVRY